MMIEIRFKIPDEIPAKLVKFIIERELNLKISRIKKIREEIQTLQLVEEDAKSFEKARQEAWNDLKKQQKL
jgi:ferritin